MRYNEQIVIIPKGTVVRTFMKGLDSKDPMAIHERTLTLDCDYEFQTPPMLGLDASVIQDRKLTPEERANWQEQEEERAGLHK